MQVNFNVYSYVFLRTFVKIKCQDVGIINNNNNTLITFIYVPLFSHPKCYKTRLNKTITKYNIL